MKQQRFYEQKLIQVEIKMFSEYVSERNIFHPQSRGTGRATGRVGTGTQTPSGQGVVRRPRPLPDANRGGDLVVGTHCGNEPTVSTRRVRGFDETTGRKRIEGTPQGGCTQGGYTVTVCSIHPHPTAHNRTGTAHTREKEIG